jgi:enoyl-CoA hydratase/carnithine racemase
MTEAAVHARRSGAVLHLVLDAPKRGNSLDQEMLSALEAHLLEAGSDPTLRVVLLEGEGKSFSTGYHIPSLLDELEQGPSVSDFNDHPLERALRALSLAEVPTVAVVGGNAYGAGCELALACDMRVASPEARFCMPPARLGVLYSVTGMRRVLELLGPALTKELLFTACVVDAQRALSLGLINRLATSRTELRSTAQILADEIAANAPLSIRHHKSILRSFLAPPPFSEEVLVEVARLREECFRSPEFARRSAKLGRRDTPQGGLGAVEVEG